MRTIERTTAFKRDFKREMKGEHRATLDAQLRFVLVALMEDRDLPERFRDHALSGNWAGHRDCHLKPDLLLIYRRVGDDLLRLVRLGSHSELFS